ncbi:MAG: alpha,alpha-trehalase [Isosphaera sp.]|nr:alpha,alpha-trehalase [Isosphaera sp.]
MGRGRPPRRPRSPCVAREPTVVPADPAPGYGPALAYVDGFWDRLIRHQTEDRGTLIGLPRPFLVPSVDPHRPLFQEFYYWDTYFMTLGVWDTARDWLVIDAAENCLYLVDRFGFIPNGTRYYFTSRSQPPFFTRMLRLAHYAKVRRHDPDAEDFLRRMLTAAVREHETCWLGEKHPHERMKYRGLSRYHDINYSHFLASCESGWDHSTRCDGARPGTEAGRWLDFLPVCLNSILYARELDLEWAFDRLADPDRARYWETVSDERAAVMRELFWDPHREFFLDFDWKHGERSPCPSLAGFFPLWAGWATQQQADAVVARWLPKFLLPGGLVTSLDAFPGRQWAYPNGWAPLQWVVAGGLDRYGFGAEAEEVRRRWCATCAADFAARGTLLEKYNVAEPAAKPESGYYGLVEGFGWTNGVLVDFARRLGLMPGEPAPAD